MIVLFKNKKSLWCEMKLAQLCKAVAWEIHLLTNQNEVFKRAVYMLCYLWKLHMHNWAGDTS